MEPAASEDERPAVAIYRAPLFNASETFVQTHAVSLRRYRPLVVGLEDKGNSWPGLRERLLVARPGERAALKPLGRSNPQQFAARTLQLNGLILPSLN